MPTPLLHETFSEPLLQWFDQHGRKDLPWQKPLSAYRVWVSEIMLQQTQVKTVIPYFKNFLECFPDIKTLAEASEDIVLAHWSGLGYYSRARNLHASAKIIHTEFNDEFPQALSILIKLPGIGETTAAAITSLAFNQPTAILDGNVKRVLSRYFLIEGVPQAATTQKKLWHYARLCMPKTRSADYTQAIMDLGATCCTTKNPNCKQCPLKTNCLATQKNQVHEYPNKKVKKTIPTKHQQFLVLYTSDQLVYLEKRPPNGIWGGLWCLPMIEIADCPATYARLTYQLEVQNIVTLITFKHSFTHYHLHIKAVALEISTTPTISVNKGTYFNRNELALLGLAKPISKILTCFYSTFIEQSALQ